MSPVGKSLVLVGACVATILVLLSIAHPPGPADVAAVSDAKPPAAGAELLNETKPQKFFFDVYAHSAGDFRALLERARMIYDETSPGARDDLKVVLVLHGPDIEFFAARNYEKYQDIVDLSAQLDAFGVFDFMMCAATATSLGLAIDDVPAFIEFVPYGPAEIDRLESAGFVEL